MESNVDVLVIGAGPAGLMFSNALAKAGVNVRIVDKRPMKVATGQADGIHSRTIEIFKSYGLAERLLTEGNHVHFGASYTPSRSGGIELTGRSPAVKFPTARFKFTVSLNQGAIESILHDSLATFGVQVERPIRPVSVQLSQNEADIRDPKAYPVRVVLEYLDSPEDKPKTEMVNAKFVLGADGAHSWVRNTLGIRMDGEDTDHVWGVIDMVPKTDFPDIRNWGLIRSNHGSCLLIPREEDKVRFYVELDNEGIIDRGTKRVDKNKTSPAKLLEIVQAIFKPYTVSLSGEVDWWTVYLVGQRVAEKFSINERIFIAGDACHTHSPKAGQGMNASMSDSHNLAWKITHVLRGWADISSLKTYEFERRKFAQDLIDFDREFYAVVYGTPRIEDSSDPDVEKRTKTFIENLQGFVTGLSIKYSTSSITDVTHQSTASKLIIGERLLPQTLLQCANRRPFEIQDLCPSDSRFKIFLFVGDLGDAKQAEKVNILANSMGKPESFVTRFGGGRREKDGWNVFDVMTISVGKKEVVNYLDVPSLFRSHWTKVFLDDLDTTSVYSAYGIDFQTGAIVVVRPDGYIGTVAPLEDLAHIETYFASFMLPS